MQQNPKVTELLQVLSDRGLSLSAIENVRESLWEQANDAFMNEVLEALTDEELQSVEGTMTPEQASEELKRVYMAKTGRNMEDEMNHIIDQYATELITKYKLESGDPVVSYSSDTSGEHISEEKNDDEKTIHDLT